MIGIDASVAINATSWACLAAASVEWTAVRAWHSYGAFDGNATANLDNAKAAGINNADVYMFPCPGKDGGEQANDLLNALQGKPYGKIWIDVEHNPSEGCAWDVSQGCVFLREVVAVLQQGGKQVGFYSSKHAWEATVGADCAIQGEYNLPLWYPHYDNSTTCDDFTAFGGWTKPKWKQFTDKPGTDKIAVCGVSVDTSASCG